MTKKPGYLAFLSSGNADEMWRVMWEVGKCPGCSEGAQTLESRNPKS